MILVLFCFACGLGHRFNGVAASPPMFQQRKIAQTVASDGYADAALYKTDTHLTEHLSGDANAFELLWADPHKIATRDRIRNLLCALSF